MIDKEKDIIIIEDKIDPTKLSIGIRCDTWDLGKLENIKYINFIYSGTTLVENGHTYKKIDTKNISERMINIFITELEEVLDTNGVSVEKGVQYILELFAKYKLKEKAYKVLIGDIGEALFIIEAEKLGIDMQQYLRKNDNGQFDFNLPDGYIEIKSSTKAKNDITFSWGQLDTKMNREIVVSKFRILENQTTILDLYKQLKQPLCELLETKRQEWSECEIIDRYSINPSECSCWFYKTEFLPKIKIEKEGSFKDMKVIVDATDGYLEPFTKLTSIIKKHA